MMSSVLNDLSP